ncbi:MAG: ATP-binding protein [Flavobacteriaceae bacterium]|nr:ATP-binding protein [Flavobacteriaceae bacterium]
MSLILIIGESGSGKSVSIRNLNCNNTRIIKIIDKPFPFKEKETKLTSFVSDNWNKVITAINKVDENKEIKTLVIDDFQYLMSNEFIRRVDEKGWDKFNDIAYHTWSILDRAAKCRSDLDIIFLTHSNTDDYGKSRCKTIGKLLDEKICIEGLFTIVFHSKIIEDKYVFQTQSDSSTIAKTPIGMFEEKYIPNDLNNILNEINKYYDKNIGENND